MSRINVVVAATSPDVKAEVIAAAVVSRRDMDLVGPGVIRADADKVGEALAKVPSFSRCALVLIGPPSETLPLAEGCLADRADLVVLHVDVVGDMVHVALRDPSLETLLSALRDLVERVGDQPQERIARVRFRSSGATAEVVDVARQASPQRPLLRASIDWVQQVLRGAVDRVPEGNGDLHGLSVTRATLLQSLDSDAAPGGPSPLAEADAALGRALSAADARTEPLAVAARALGLGALEFRLMVLALAPELDHRYQRCLGFLLDEMGRRVGTMGLYAALLGASVRARGRPAGAGPLDRWLVFEASAGRPSAADEPLRLDPFLARWLLGERSALAQDPRVRRAIRLAPWPGIVLLERREERAHADRLVDKLQGSSKAQWVLFGGDDPAGWRALLELGSEIRQVEPIRVETARFAGLDVLDVEESACRVGRMARLTGRPLIVDATRSEDAEGGEDGMRVLLATLGATASQAAVICRDEARIVRLLGQASCELVEGAALPAPARVAAVRTAAAGADALLTAESAEKIATQYPLDVDDLESAMRLARGRAKAAAEPGSERFTAACRQVAAKGVSHLAERIEPVFSLDLVVLPSDRKRQLDEIVDNVELAPRVLDGWKFRDQLPYGRGVSALFFGPSGTGKTMAALGIARRLGIQILRLDLSKVVSKYIGDTEKNIDRVFHDAQRSGSVILIDEADALLGKRSEVKDAHDRYANIEVAYLLQRMEAYEGLAILTTNFRQNLDPAFLRRLRFIVEFPRPDVEAREQIWRQCLPEKSHALDDAAFRQLARRIDLTGGHIRQITLRAAFIAAAANKRITLEHVAHAARAEFAKLGMPTVQIDQLEEKKVA